MLDLPVVVLCGGLGTRLRPAVADRPKALAAVGDRPFLAVQLELLRARGARRFVLCVGHMAEQIEAEFGAGASLGVRIDYSRDGEKLLGTGGALKRAAGHFAPAAVVVNGDTYLDVDLARLARVHASARVRGAVATLTLAHVPDASRFGAVELRGNRVVGFGEKSVPGTGWVNAGAYVIERELLDRVPAEEVVSLERDVFPAALRDGLRLAAVAHEEPFTDIGTPDAYRAFVSRRAALHAA
ncbi:MAG: nucleotidyltransferase family protein [Planctomycetes bacterium]|nr:nucleotidyltransferase family protein [Planctomycetota bacterium]